MNTRINSNIQKFFLVMLALAIMLPFAAAVPAQAASSVPGTDPVIPLPICRKNCMRVTDISLTKQVSNDPPLAVAVVTVKQPVSDTFPKSSYIEGAGVYAIWTFPNGANKIVYGTTNRFGQAVFQVEASDGVFTFTIVNVVKNNYTFDRYNSVLTKSIK